MITVRAPILSARQEALWRATIAFGTRLPADAWTVVGGQMCHLHAWERGGAIPRPTSDLDAGLNARDHPRVGVDATQRLKDAGFEPVRTSVDGPQVRWSRDGLVIDVVLPAGLARRDDRRRKLDVDGRVMLESHGVQQALGRS